MNEEEARKLETKTAWDTIHKEWRCAFCGQKHSILRIATGHDHTDYKIDFCECRSKP